MTLRMYLMAFVLGGFVFFAALRPCIVHGYGVIAAVLSIGTGVGFSVMELKLLKLLHRKGYREDL